MHLLTKVWAWGLSLSIVIAAGCSGSGHGNTAEAAMPNDPPVDAIDELTATLEEMGVRASARPAMPPSVQPATNSVPDIVFLGDPPPTTPEGVAEDVGTEIALLRDHIHQLESSLTFYMDTVVTDLREENAYLRDELARIYAAIPLEDRMRPVVPRPGSGVLNEVQDIAEDPVFVEELTNPRLDPSLPLELVVAKEWGRTPEEAAEIGPKVSSLRGMIGSVQQGAADEALLEFARELHDQYADYTNINIVIFDSEAAAAAYAERNAKSTPRHVLTIARHANTGLDEIYLHRNGLVVHTERY